MMPAHESSAVMTAPPASTPSLARRLRNWFLGTVGIVVVVFGLLVLNNNFSLFRPSRATFDAQLDRALDSAINWINANREVSERNPSIMYMLADMEIMSGDPRLKSLLEDYRKRMASPQSKYDYFWARIVDSSGPLPVLTVQDLQWIGFEAQWDAFAIAPSRVELPEALQQDLFSPTRYYWGARQHQILALLMYRHFNGSSPELDQTINYLAEKIARDQHYDFRVTDSYDQRVAFVLAAERPDLIRSRWVERVLDYQNPDGSWSYCWHGWCRGIFEFGFKYNPGHPTVQAAWMLTMLKYRYPQWIAQHYK